MSSWKESNKKKRGNTLIVTIAAIGMCMVVVASYLHFSGRTKNGFNRSKETINEQFDIMFEN
jgi:flagellar basal body-associated protein FliL